MSEIIPSNRVERIWSSLKDQDYRRGFAESHVGGFLAAQLHALRKNRGWTQRTLAKVIGTNQPQISAWESTCESANIKTLQKFAEAYDVALIVKFVAFSELAREVATMIPDRNIPAYEEDSPSAGTFAMRSIRVPLDRPSLINPNVGDKRSSYYTGKLSTDSYSNRVVA
jgi:transcriptional regulator with XRE-family HTH domain